MYFCFRKGCENCTYVLTSFAYCAFSSISLHFSHHLKSRLPAIKVKYLLLAWLGILIASWVIYMQYASYSELCRGHVCHMVIVSILSKFKALTMSECYRRARNHWSSLCYVHTLCFTVSGLLHCSNIMLLH